MIIIGAALFGICYHFVHHHNFVTEKMEPPVFVQKPFNKDVKEGVKVRFDAVVKGVPLPDITWYICFLLLIFVIYHTSFVQADTQL